MQRPRNFDVWLYSDVDGWTHCCTEHTLDDAVAHGTDVMVSRVVARDTGVYVEIYDALGLVKRLYP